MEVLRIETGANNFIECVPGSGQIASEQDALDVIAACAEHQVQRVLLHASNLSEDFYHLSTGLAGAVLLKFSNYSVKLAAVLTPELVNQGRFKDMALEVNRRDRLFHIFYSRPEAAAWLAAE